MVLKPDRLVELGTGHQFSLEKTPIISQNRVKSGIRGKSSFASGPVFTTMF